MWGQNAKGELGLGTGFIEQAMPEMNCALKTKQVKSLVCGSSFTLALGQEYPQSKSKSPSPHPQQQSSKQPQKSFPQFISSAGCNSSNGNTLVI